MIKLIDIEDFSSFYNEYKDIIEEHYNHCEQYRASSKPINMDLETIQALVEEGSMNPMYILEDEKAIGYINITIFPDVVLSDYLAVADFLYILPEHRGKGVVEEVFSMIENSLVSLGITDLNISLPDKEYSAKVAEKLGYVETSRTYCKILGDN